MATATVLKTSQVKIIKIKDAKTIMPAEQTIERDDLIQFQVTFPAGKDQCKLAICAIEFEDSTKPMLKPATTAPAPLGTIKIGS